MGPLDVLEGAWPGTVVLMSFRARKSATDCYHSAAYRAIFPLRNLNAISDLGLIDQLPEGFTVKGASTPLTAALTDADGPYAFRNLPSGEYRLQLDRIGYEKIISSTLRVTPEKTLTYDIRGAATPLKLSAMKVMPGRCLNGEQLGEDPQLQTLWNEARKGVEGRREFELRYRFTRTLTQDIKIDRRFMPDVTQHRVGSSVSEPDSVAAELRRAQEAHR